ncbi:MAG: flagellar basal body P-ring formation protein FlgA [Bradyrhizobiaceae bacterium]|nr:flagellar basal body P-ring formation protein FlgA [Hyphomicrobiales bacterium]MBV9426475.1 flagellar basal body P-ring formation protein FlgA [Bradyrhizobiaceae bacterium]
MRVAVIAALLAFGPGAVARAADPAAPPLPTLKRAAVVSADIVRIGDLIDGAGPAAGIAIFRAPDIGETGSVPAYQVLAAARAYGLERVDSQGTNEVAVTRAGRVLVAKDIEAAIARTLVARGGVADAHDLAVTLDREPSPLRLETAGDLRALYTYYNARSGRFDITFELTDEAAHRVSQRYSGYAVETLPVAVTLRPLARGEIVKAADVTIEHRSKAEFREGAPAATDVAGLAARRPVRAGQPLRASDLMRPEIVQRNETVTLVYEVPGIVLTVRGKAVEPGAEGDVISVINTQSNRTVQGTVAGPARVVVRSGAPRIVTSDAGLAPAPAP